MATLPKGRVQAQILSDDIEAYQALATMADYDPRDPNTTLEALTASYNTLRADEAALIRSQVALDTARDKLAATERRFHTQMLDVKNQVKAQYGEDSNELAALGLKKKSEKNTSGRRGRGGAAGGGGSGPGRP